MDSYRDILARALKHEHKQHRDQVLSTYPEQVQARVRAMMEGMAKRLATSVQYAGCADGCPGIDARRRRLSVIEPEWLRRRVENIVRERFEAKRREETHQSDEPPRPDPETAQAGFQALHDKLREIGAE